ncbi:MAG: glycine--tRNA ligase [Candidatus Bathyarchaeia archaeon]
MSKADKFDKVTDLAKRRGFFWPSYELYGGVGGFIDYGPLGTLMKRKIEEKWIETFVKGEGLLLIDTPVVTPAVVFEASGHTTHFTDPVSRCLRCGRKWRADQLLEEQAHICGEGLSLIELGTLLKEKQVHCPECGGELEEPQPFNELFKTTIGPYSESVGYGRPETAQGIFVNFKRLYELAKNKIPFGVAQVGRCLRNEISPRQGPIRLRELTIMEFEFFFDAEAPCERIKAVEAERLRLLHEALVKRGANQPEELTVKEALERGYIRSPWNAYFMVLAKRFLAELGIPNESQAFKEKLAGERAHYSAQTYDQVVELSRWGLVEVSGHAWRTDYDLKMHMVRSGEDLRAFVPYESPRRVKRLSVIACAEALSKSFGEEATYITRLLELTPPAQIQAAFQEKGYFDLKGDGKDYRILPSHLQLQEVEIEETGKRFIPHVAEPSFGSDRIFYAVLENAYTEREGRVVLRLPRTVAPFNVAVFPLASKDGLPEKAEELYRELKKTGFDVIYEVAGSIGRRYARADEVGVPIAVTVDYRTMEDGTVTLRNRDTWSQVRAAIEDLPARISRYLRGELGFDDLGSLVS